MSQYQYYSRHAHNQLQDEQDQHIEEITEIAQHLKQQSKEMNYELQKQHGYA